MVFGDINKLHALKQSLQMTSVALPLPALIFPAAGARAFLSLLCNDERDREADRDGENVSVSLLGVSQQDTQPRSADRRTAQCGDRSRIYRR